MFELKNKIALVTGACRGMGKAHVLMLAKQGAKVAVTDINLKECKKVVSKIIKNGGEAIAVKLDVSDKSQVDKAISKIVKKWKRLDILVNNAGIINFAKSLKLSEKDWDRVLAINLKGQFLCAQRAAKEMAKNKEGRIINISSIGSGGVGVGFAEAAHYAASKGGIIGLTESLASEWAEYGITVNAIAPGAINTPMIKPISNELKSDVKLRVPLGRMGRPDEVSAMAVFLASKESSYITGATFYVDGGWLAQ